MIEQIKKSISEIIKFDSAQTAPEKNAPFGAGARKSLDYFLNLASALGFETVDYDGYAGEVIYGDGEEFAILAHLDVVPAGEGWTHDPFGGEIDEVNRRIWGRGTMDDKGPALCALYALKALRDAGLPLKRRVRLIFGLNEETGSADMKYYTAHGGEIPVMGITPEIGRAHV